jgi:hypothetical protein
MAARRRRNMILRCDRNCKSEVAPSYCERQMDVIMQGRAIINERSSQERLLNAREVTTTSQDATGKRHRIDLTERETTICLATPEVFGMIHVSVSLRRYLLSWRLTRRHWSFARRPRKPPGKAPRMCVR